MAFKQNANGSSSHKYVYKMKNPTQNGKRQEQSIMTQMMFYSTYRYVLLFEEGYSRNQSKIH